MAYGISRRDFLKTTAAGAATLVLAGCQQPRRWVTLEPYVRPPEEQLAGVATWYASTCRQCPAGCGILVRVMNGRALKIEGNPEHPLNRGKLCARGQSGLQLLYNPDRLPGPVRQDVRGSREYRAISWDEGLNELLTMVQEGGPRLAVWLGSTTSAHLYQIFNDFTAALGAPKPVVFDLYTAMAGYDDLRQNMQASYGQDGLPAYDLGHADVVYSFGSDILGTWLSAVRYGVEYGAFRSQPLGKRGYLAQFEPRMSTTAAKADLWVPIPPGSEGLIAQALIASMAEGTYGSGERVARAQALAADVNLEDVSAAVGIPVEEITRLARTFIEAERPLALPGTNPQAVASVQQLNIVAGTANLAGGLLLPGAGAEAPIGVVPSTDEAAKSLIQRMASGQVDLLLVHGANPLYELPPQWGFAEAVQKVANVVSFATLVDETAVWADLILPDRSYLESWGTVVVSPDFGWPTIGSQQPVVTPVFDARSTADVILAAARGVPSVAEALPLTDEVAVLKEMVQRLPTYDGMAADPDVRWARFRQHGGWWPQERPLPRGTPSPSSQPISQAQMPIPSATDNQDYPYNAYLYLSDLLSDGRGASQPWLQGVPDPMTTIAWQTWIELHPETAKNLNVTDGDVVRLTSAYGEIEAPVYTYPAIRPDTVAMPVGQGHTDCGRYARGRGSNPIALLGSPDDKSSGLPFWSVQKVAITPTGQRVNLAVMENKLGVQGGFINQDLPG